MKRKIRVGVLGIVFLACFIGCSKDDKDPVNIVDEKALSEYTTPERVNKFIVDCTHSMYLWESATDWTQYQDYETYSHEAYQGDLASHNALFSRFIHEDDQWSQLTEDIEAMKSEFDGISTTYGYRLIFGKFSNEDAYFAIVLYVTPGAPADLAGIRRGDLIVGIDGGFITASNISDLYYSSKVVLHMGEIDGESIREKEDPVFMTAVEMYENPILDYRIIEKGVHKIGYLCYTAYQTRSEEDLVQVFQTFKAERVTDVVLDLRYNGGGYASTSQILASILAPASVVQNEEVYLTHQWNDLWMDVYGEENTTYFWAGVPVNMDLKRLYVITTSSTASASEATIISLDPYLDIVQIGETTSGKYCGGLLLSPFDYYGLIRQTGVTNDYLLNISNWGMYVMVYKYANKNNYPSFVTGLPPTIQAEEDYFALKSIGAETDPLLGAALEAITGELTVEKRSMRKMQIPSGMSYPDIQLERPTDGKMIVKKPDLYR